MICPKCQGRMQTFDRMGIHLEQCDSCRGIFLDRGELEQIVAAEQRHYGGAVGHAPARPYRDSPRGYGRPDSPAPFHGGHGGYSDSPRPYGHGGYSDSPRPYGHQRRRKSFLEDLFD
ncbi:zf-TFIIB domain-containing protein [Streptomonospora sp. S1-112]|uniref:Zf-TFIIB domain-containing protein n=1 Tax=Streptomonospora mangrovi TaxID=2883123 RepID=A0A9X3NN11_9ACTN|nr:zf-TFIIB domain-containing protein [Streptomonospora mangrovi]MDA0565113.1 zf-TFIIB domain-containing protein [Streptomonospora mangrovi]